VRCLTLKNATESFFQPAPSSGIYSAMPEPGVSVIIPVFNNPDGLNACLEALVNQRTERRFEVVVVDDASTENLEPVHGTFKDRLNLNWHRHERNGGPAIARNTGIQAARGELILFTDGDCMPEPQWLEALSSPFSNPEVSGAKGVYRTAQKDVWSRLAQLEFEERYDLLRSQSDIDFVDTYSGAFRRSDLIELNGFDTTFPEANNEDVDLSFRIKERGGRFVFAPEAVVWHKHREGFWNYARLKFGRGFWRMKVYRKHPSKAGRDSYTPWTLKAQLTLMAIAPLALVFSFFGRSRPRSSPGTGLGTFSAAWFGACLITCIPLGRIALFREPELIPVIPFFLATRATALLAGIFASFSSAFFSAIFK